MKSQKELEDEMHKLCLKAEGLRAQVRFIELKQDQISYDLDLLRRLKKMEDEKNEALK